MRVWGDRWLVAVQPSTAGSQQGEIHANGTYIVSRSAPSAYKRSPSPLSPVMMESLSSSTFHHLSSDFKHSTPPPSSQGLSSLEEMFLLENPLCSDGGESFRESSRAAAASSSQDYAFNFNAEPPSFLLGDPIPATISSAYHPFFSSSPFSNSTALSPEGHVVSDADAAPIYPSDGPFSDWIASTGLLPVNDVAHSVDEVPYTPPFSVSSPFQNAADFLTTSWSGNIRHRSASQSIPVIGGYSNSPMSISPMYNGYDSPHTMLGNPLLYRRSVSGPPLSPSVTRTTLSGSVASLYSIDSPLSMSSEMFSRSSDYGDLDYNHSSPHSGCFTGSPDSVSSASGGLEMSYASVRRNVASRTIPLPYPNTPLLRRGNHI
ncbi:hypothetical protein B0H12DRAFT_200389 [Mycena haematopus]|nr:hypothetical protein B0H12DRAFT_200389 [Mycena haematopus]